MTSRLAAAVLLFATLAVARPAGLDDTFAAGETLDFHLSWLKVAGGSARMTIAPDPTDASRYRITSVAKSSSGFARFFKVRDQMESFVARNSFSTLHYEKHLDERGKVKHEVTTIDPARNVATRKGKEITVPSPIYDPLSILYYIRKLELSPGKTFKFEVLADGKLYSLSVSVYGRETIKTDAGTFKCVIVEPKMAKGGIYREDSNRLLVWYSDDDRHLPVRIRSEVKVGTITATLKAVQGGASDIEPPVQ